MGTRDRLRDIYASHPDGRIPFYRAMYENCTIVTTNLEIVHLYPNNRSEFDLSFFENIREVHGYVLVASNLVSRVPLTSLRVIRGRSLFQFPRQTDSPESRNYSLFVADNTLDTLNSSSGLTYLELPNLMG